MKSIFLNKFFCTTSLNIFSVGALVLGLFSGTANAGTATGTLALSANVTSSCTVTGGSISFGNIDPIAATGPVDTNNSIKVKCSNTTQYSVGMDGGQNMVTGFGRNMKNGSNSLAYQLYSDSAYTSVWSNAGAGVGAAVAGTGTGAEVSIPVYGRIANLLGAVPGAYLDTVTITVTY